MGKGKSNKELKTTTSLRVRASDKELIVRAYGSVQKFFDEKLEAEKAGYREAVVETEGEEVTADDF